MKIYLRDIKKEEGLNVSEDFSPEYIGLGENDPLYFTSPVHVDASFQLVDNYVLGNFSVSGHFVSYCYRTMERLERDWRETFSLDFEAGPDTEYIEVNEDVRQEIITRVPSRILSDAEAAKGESAVIGSEDKDVAKEGRFKGMRTYRPFEDLPDLQ